MPNCDYCGLETSDDKLEPILDRLACAKCAEQYHAAQRTTPEAIELTQQEIIYKLMADTRVNKFLLRGLYLLIGLLIALTYAVFSNDTDISTKTVTLVSMAFILVTLIISYIKENNSSSHIEANINQRTHK